MARYKLALVSGLLSALVFSTGAWPASAQHGPTTDHLLGSGAFGNIELVGHADLTDTPDLVADVTVSPNGQYAFLANWGEAKCPANSEAGGINNPDAGAWVVDIRDLAHPKKVGFIAGSQDSRPGEGMQVVNITTKQFSGDVLVMNNEQCGKNGKGGISLWDVTDPLKPVKLSEHFGDRGKADTNEIHSAFAWDTGDNAYAVMTDNAESGLADVDILDITNPKRPRLIRELDLDAMFPQITQPSLGLNEVFLHDMVVKKIGGNWVMLLSFWDAGYVQLNVNDPANPTLIGDTDYNNPDPQLLEATGASLTPEGNGHEAEFTSDNRFFIGTDEDFGPYRTGEFRITSGTNQGVYPSVIVPGAAAPGILPDHTLNGPVVYGGYGCPASAPIPSPGAAYVASLAPGEEKIVVLQRGPVGDPTATEEACFPGEKAHQAKLAGWDAVLFVARHVVSAPPEPVPPFCGSGAFVDTIVGVCTTHEAYHKLFGQSVSYTYPDGPALGTVGERIRADSIFDGWGYVHLFGNTLSGGKFPELDTFAIPEGENPAFANGFGDLTVHEVATDPQSGSRAYLSYYNGGFRALQIKCSNPADQSTCDLVQTGGYLDPKGNDFWGVEAFVRDGVTYILASDRDDGLWIFKRKSR